MSSKKLVVAAAAAVLLLATYAAVVRPGRPVAPVSSARSGEVVEVARDASGGERAESPIAAENPAPTGVDLAAADRDLDLHGRVVGPDGAAVPHARILSFTRPFERAAITRFGTAGGIEFGPETVSDAEGAFALRLPRGRMVSLRVTAPGFAQLDLPGCLAGERVELRLQRGVRLRIEAIDSGGALLSGVRGRLLRPDPIAGWGAEVRREGVAGADDALVFEGLPGGTWAYLTLVHPSHRPERVSQRVDLPTSGELRLRVPFVPGRSLAVQVRDAATGEPIAGARVGRSALLDFALTTDADGHALLTGLRRQLWQIHAAAEGYAPGTALARSAESLVLALQPGASVAGRVVDASGAPVPGAIVGAVGADATALSRVGGRSDADGRFALSGLSPDAGHVLVFWAAGHGRTRRDFDTGPGASDPRDLGDLVLQPPRSVEGRVLDADGEPVADLRVQLKGDTGSALAESERRRTDDLGRFRFPDLAPAAYRVTVVPSGSASVAADADVTTGDVTDLELRIAGTTPFRARVVDDAGTPLAGVPVRVKLADDSWLQVPTDPDGWAVFRAHAAIREVDASGMFHPSPHAPRVSAAIPEGQSEAELVLARTDPIRGRVVLPDGSPAGICSLRVTVDGEVVHQGSSFGPELGTDAEGRFEIHVPPGSRADVRLVSAPARSFGARPLVVHDGLLEGVAAGSEAVEMRLREAALDRSLDLRVLGVDGTPEPGAIVEVFAGGAASPAVTSGRGGRAVIVDLPDRPASVRVRLANDHPRAAEWFAPLLEAVPTQGAGDTDAHEIRFVAGLPFSGQVLDRAGHPADGVTIVVVRGGRVLQTLTTGPDGRFARALDPAQTSGLSLQAWKRYAGPETHEVRIEEFRPAAGMRLRLAAPR